MSVLANVFITSDRQENVFARGQQTSLDGVVVQAVVLQGLSWD
jgi:hypothetical protein